MTNDDVRAVAFSVAIFAMLSFAWYHVWVKPNDQRMYAIMDCMNDMSDHSKKAYALCSRNVEVSLNETR